MLHSFITLIKLRTQLAHLDISRLQHLIALLPLFLQLEDSAAESIEILQHDQPLDVRECLFRVLVERVRLFLFAKCRADNVLDALRGEELVLDYLQVGLVAYTMQSRRINLFPVEGWAVAAAPTATFGFRTIASVFWRAAAEVTQTVVFSV